MMGTGTWRQRALIASLVATIALVVATGEERGAPAAPAVPRAPRSARPHGQPASPQLTVELDRLRAAAAPSAARSAADAFRPTSWYVPPPPPPPKPPVKPLPPPPPTAPPLPFTYMGRYEDGAKKIVLLVRSDRIYTVSEGEVIDNTYRVDRLTEGQLELTYLPLNIKQTLSTGGT